MCEKDCFKILGIADCSIRLQMERVFEYQKTLNEVQKCLLEFRDERVKKLMNIIIRQTNKVLGEEWKITDQISTGRGYYLLYKKTWSTEWYVHFEWNIKDKELFNANSYTLVLHVEGKCKCNEYFTLLNKHLSNENAPIADVAVKRNVWSYPFYTENGLSLGEMTEEQIEKYLRTVYLSKDVQSLISVIDATAIEYKQTQ